MTVTPTSPEALWSDAIVQLVADSTTFQTLTDTDDDTEAKAFILEDDGGEDAIAVDGTTELDTDAACWAVVRLGAMRRVERAIATFGWEGDATVAITVRTEEDDTPADCFRRARNVAGEMMALVGTSATRPQYLVADVGEVFRTAPDSDLKGAMLVVLSITFRDIP